VRVGGYPSPTGGSAGGSAVRIVVALELASVADGYDADASRRDRFLSRLRFLVTPPAAGNKVVQVKATRWISFKWNDVMNFGRDT
jgi:hypothetical protein